MAPAAGEHLDCQRAGPVNTLVDSSNGVVIAEVVASDAPGATEPTQFTRRLATGVTVSCVLVRRAQAAALPTTIAGTSHYEPLALLREGEDVSVSELSTRGVRRLRLPRGGRRSS